MIKLGQKVKDRITGFEGVAVSRPEYLNGCVKIGVQGPVRDGRVPEPDYFDEMQLGESSAKSGGPQPLPRGLPNPK